MFIANFNEETKKIMIIKLYDKKRCSIRSMKSGKF